MTSPIYHIETLDAMIAGRHLLQQPFYRELGEGRLARAVIEEYARQNYRHVDVFPRYISAIHCQCEDLTIRQELLENLVEEERGEENHPELWLRFTDALGLARDEVVHAVPRQATTALVYGMLDIARERSVAEGLAALYAYEAQIPEVAQHEMDGFRRHYGVTDPAALKFFTVHMEADLVHRQVGRDILLQLVHDDNAEVVLEAASRTLDALNAYVAGMRD